jgi:hypothetical protein
VILKQVVPMRRASRHLHAALQQAREHVPGDRDLISCRDEAGSVERGAELVTAEAQNGLEYAMAVSSHRLNRMVAIFFPIAFRFLEHSPALP